MFITVVGPNARLITIPIDSILCFYSDAEDVKTRTVIELGKGVAIHCGETVEQVKHYIQSARDKEEWLHE
jgi:hypothetical protein